MTNAMSTIDHSDEESNGDYVLHYDQIDMDNFEFGGARSIGCAYEAMVQSKNNEDETCQFCLPTFKIGPDGLQLDLKSGKKNENVSFAIDPDVEDHVELVEWLHGFDNWVVQSIIYNHPRWFGHLWEEGGKMHGKPKPPPEVLAQMFEPVCDGSSFSVRVPVRKGKPQIECFDIEHTTIPYNSVKNVDVIPVVEFKGIRLYGKKSCCDIVLRGICAQSSYQDIGVEYNICSVEAEDAENDNYGTDDSDNEENQNNDPEHDENDKDDENDEDDEGDEDEESPAQVVPLANGVEEIEMP